MPVVSGHATPARPRPLPRAQGGTTPRLARHEVVRPDGGDDDDDVHILDTPEAGVKSLRGGALRIGGYGIGLLLGLISAPLLIRHLGVVDFGRYVTVTSIVGLVAAG